MHFPPGLLAHIIRLAADSSSSGRRRKDFLLHLELVSRLFRTLAEHELLRRAYVDATATLDWLDNSVEEGGADLVEEIEVVFHAGERMLDRARVLHLLARLKELKRLEMRYKPTSEQVLTSTLGLAALTHLTVSNISLDFPLPSAFPVFSSLLSLTLTDARLTLPPPSPAGAVLPPASFPKLKTLALLDAPGIDARSLPYSRAPVYSERHVLPFLDEKNEGAGQGLEELTLDPLLVKRMARRDVPVLLERAKASGVRVRWDSSATRVVAGEGKGDDEEE
ncbi:hypothetical protein JCM8097_007762 [Rhodosporidiobolus ruineniae]